MKNAIKEKRQKAALRARRVRARIHGTAECPRLTVKRSAKHIYAQLINDATGKTLASASDFGAGGGKGKPMDTAAEGGKTLGEKAVAGGIKRAVMDRGSYKYHGRVKALAEAVQAAGVSFSK